MLNKAGIVLLCCDIFVTLVFPGNWTHSLSVWTQGNVHILWILSIADLKLVKMAGVFFLLSFALSSHPFCALCSCSNKHCLYGEDDMRWWLARWSSLLVYSGNKSKPKISVRGNINFTNKHSELLSKKPSPHWWAGEVQSPLDNETSLFICPTVLPPTKQNCQDNGFPCFTFLCVCRPYQSESVHCQGDNLSKFQNLSKFWKYILLSRSQIIEFPMYCLVSFKDFFFYLASVLFCGVFVSWII